eukprot:scaffold49593_cov63-Phaeocystis_antarctica.AAC.3
MAGASPSFDALRERGSEAAIVESRSLCSSCCSRVIESRSSAESVGTSRPAGAGRSEDERRSLASSSTLERRSVTRGSGMNGAPVARGVTPRGATGDGAGATLDLVDASLGAAPGCVPGCSLAGASAAVPRARRPNGRKIAAFTSALILAPALITAPAEGSDSDARGRRRPPLAGRSGISAAAPSSDSSPAPSVAPGSAHLDAPLIVVLFLPACWQPAVAIRGRRRGRKPCGEGERDVVVLIEDQRFLDLSRRCIRLALLPGRDGLRVHHGTHCRRQVVHRRLAVSHAVLLRPLQQCIAQLRASPVQPAVTLCLGLRCAQRGLRVLLLLHLLLLFLHRRRHHPARHVYLRQRLPTARAVDGAQARPWLAGLGPWAERRAKEARLATLVRGMRDPHRRPHRRPQVGWWPQRRSARHSGAHLLDQVSGALEQHHRALPHAAWLLLRRRAAVALGAQPGHEGSVPLRLGCRDHLRQRIVLVQLRLQALGQPFVAPRLSLPHHLRQRVPLLGCHAGAHDQLIPMRRQLLRQHRQRRGLAVFGGARLLSMRHE